HRLVVEEAGPGEARGLALLRGADVEQLLDRARVEQRLELPGGDLLHPGGAIRVLDLEAGAARALDEVDDDAVAAPGAHAVELHGDAVALDRHVAGLLGTEI